MRIILEATPMFNSGRVCYVEVTDSLMVKLALPSFPYLDFINYSNSKYYKNSYSNLVFFTEKLGLKVQRHIAKWKESERREVCGAFEIA